MPFMNTIYNPNSDVAGPHTHQVYASSQHLKLQLPSAFASSTAGILSPHRSTNHTLPSRRGSQDAGVAHAKQPRKASSPYVIAQSPTRVRFSQQDTSALHSAYPPPHAHIRHSAAIPEARSDRSSCTSESADSPPRVRGDRHQSLSRSLSVLSVSSDSASSSSIGSIHSSGGSPRNNLSKGRKGRRSASGKQAGSEVLVEGGSSRFNRGHRQPGVDGPMNHICLPQGPLNNVIALDPKDKIYPPIQFFVDGMPEPGIRVGDVLSRNPPIKNGNAPSFSNQMAEKTIFFWVSWPGYPPAKKRVHVNGGMVSRHELITSVCMALQDWMKDAVSSGPSDPRFPEYAVKKKMNLDRVFVTELYHLGNANWGLELWVPSQMI